MRSALGGAVTFGLMALAALSCRRDKTNETGMGNAPGEPSAHMPSVQDQPRTDEGKRAIGGGPAGAIPRTSPAGAVASIVVARCDREVRCNNVGPNKSYKTRGECISKMQSEKYEGISANKCPGGINEGNLNRCLQAIHEDHCGNVLDTLSRLESCKEDGLCMK